MRPTYECMYILLVAIFRCSVGQSFVDYQITRQANIELTVNNLGMIGNSFRGQFQTEGWGSMEYPAKSGIEHLFNGGLWVGGIKNGQKLVSTGAISSSQGYQTGAKGYEFTAEPGSRLLQRSKLLDNQFYDPRAVSHQDLVGNFTDKNVLIPNSTIRITDHTQPLQISGIFEAYNWNFASANFFVPLKFTLTNSGSEKIDSVWIGFWANFVIRNLNVYVPVGTPFFSSGGNAYIDSLCLSMQWDAEDITSNSQSYAGLKFLGAVDQKGVFRHPKIQPNFKCNYNTWLFSSGAAQFFRPDNDNEFFLRLSGGMEDQPEWEISQVQMKNKGNRSVLLSVGPFGTLAPGESIEVTFGVFCASTFKDGNPPHKNTAKQASIFFKNANALQRSYNGEDVNFNGKLDPGEDADNNGVITRWIFPEPPPKPHTKIIAKDNQIEVYWTSNSVFALDPVTKKRDFEGFRIYKTQVGFDMQDEKSIEKQLTLVASFDIAGNGLFFDTGLDSITLKTPVRFEGDTNVYTYKYTFTQVANGWQHAISLTAFDAGNDSINLESLESSVLQNLKRVFPGKPANTSLQSTEPFVYPNPYYGLAAWEGSSKFEEDRKLYFSNLPEQCRVRIFTFSGDLVDEFTHDQTYNGSNTRWASTYSDVPNTVFSGGEHAWDLMSANGQLLARGLYIFTVEDLKSGLSRGGKFMIIK